MTPRTPEHQASLSFTIFCSLFKHMSIESVMPSDYLILRHPLLLLPSIFPASESFPVSQLFTSSGQILELQLQHQSFQEYLGLVSFRIDCFDLLAIQGPLKSLLQHHSSKTSIFQCSAFFFIVQFSHQYVTTGKTIALTM